MTGKLYLVPTPVGNLEDISFRAIRILKEADIILAEDTRTSSKLLKHYEISSPVVSHHQFNEHKKLPGFIQYLQEGKTLALISDAGTPSISDPGFLITRECIEKNIPVECLPGPVAFIPALAVSGLPADRFAFEGFLPHKKGRQKRLKALKEETRTMVFFESPYRLVKLLEQFGELIDSQRNACICREISKIHEEHIRGRISELTEQIKKKPVKGECVVVIAGK